MQQQLYKNWCQILKSQVPYLAIQTKESILPYHMLMTSLSCLQKHVFPQAEITRWCAL